MLQRALYSQYYVSFLVNQIEIENCFGNDENGAEWNKTKKFFVIFSSFFPSTRAHRVLLRETGPTFCCLINSSFQSKNILFEVGTNENVIQVGISIWSNYYIFKCILNPSIRLFLFTSFSVLFSSSKKGWIVSFNAIFLSVVLHLSSNIPSSDYVFVAKVYDHCQWKR